MNKFRLIGNRSIIGCPVGCGAVIENIPMWKTDAPEVPPEMQQTHCRDRAHALVAICQHMAAEHSFEELEHYGISLPILKHCLGLEIFRI